MWSRGGKSGANLSTPQAALQSALVVLAPAFVKLSTFLKSLGSQLSAVHSSSVRWPLCVPVCWHQQETIVARAADCRPPRQLHSPARRSPRPARARWSSACCSEFSTLSLQSKPCPIKDARGVQCSRLAGRQHASSCKDQAAAARHMLLNRQSSGDCSNKLQPILAAIISI